ncbi:nucleoporin Nup120/160-domain-containing protein [Xylariomycetidae sp. FL2044]|nr:nucleoporin Nup120/160-domain-containing protein [Xylariomycetidae sp. FL2044]
MPSRETLYSYKETRLNFETPSSAFTVDVKLPSATTQNRSRRQLGRTNLAKSDSTIFRTQNCATASATYHRKYHASPRNFLWRVLEDDTVLSIRAIDLCKQKALDTNLVLNFRFPYAIRPTCVALADPPDHDALSIFVLDTANQLYTLFLRPDSFRKRAFAEGGLGDACKVFAPNAFQNFKHPYRLMAVNNDQLVVSLSDGGHIKLDKKKSHNAPHMQWKETFFNAKGWIQGFRSIIGGRGDLDITAAAAAAQTNLGLDNASFLLTVCLDHCLRVWNLKNGQMVRAMDLLDAVRDPQETGKWQLDSAQTNLIRIVGQTEGKRLCVTYSPVASGEFKFWSLQCDDEDSMEVKDLYPDTQLIPQPPLGSDVWTLADFSIIESRSSHRFGMWILWKNNMAYRVQELTFLVDQLPESWQHNWRSVFSDTSIPAAQLSGAYDATDATEKWLRLILAPGRFPKATLDAALRAYERAMGRQTEASSRSNRELAEVVCDAISSTAVLNKTSQGEMDHEQFRSTSEGQWRKFYRILVELDKPRGEALSLAYEPELGMPWIICADSISAIRECNRLELICHNPHYRADGFNEESAIINTARNFVEGFSDSMLQICHAVLRSELFDETSKTDQERIQFFSDKAGFWRQISDEDCSQVTDVLGPNFNAVSMRLYQEVLDVCSETWKPQHPTENPLTDLGRKVIVKAAQDIADLQWNVCFSQLILLVHMEFEFDRPEDALHNRLNIGAIYRGLLKSLHRLELVKWLANTPISSPLSKVDRSSPASGNSPLSTKRQVEDLKVITALEGNVGHLLGLPEINPTSSQAASSIVTSIAADLCAQDSDVELQPQYIQCGLLVRDRADLALELQPFCDRGPFSTYVQGRVHLALKDFSTSALFFKKAAFGMSISPAATERHSSGLLDDTEWKSLYAGLPHYYTHIVDLFERQKAYSFVAEFARLALQFVNRNTRDADDVRTNMQTRLFSGAIATSQFELAHSTLVAMANRTLQQSCLKQLIQKMCDNLHNAEFVELSFPGLQNAVDEILEQRCHNTVDVITGVPYHQILYAWRIKRNDFRGAAAILLDRITKLRQLGEGDQWTGDDVLDTAVTRQYLVLINVLSCVEQKQAWIATEDPPQQANSGKATTGSKRRVVTLADIRKEYQNELDRIAAIQNNQFGLAADDEMEIL